MAKKIRMIWMVRSIDPDGNSLVDSLWSTKGNAETRIQAKIDQEGCILLDPKDSSGKEMVWCAPLPLDKVLGID